MLELRYHRVLPVSAETAWKWIAEPELMNQWSTAKVRSTSLGDGQHPAGTGALRSISIKAPLQNVFLEEVIEHSDAPRALDYRVLKGAPVKMHKGHIRIEEREEGAVLSWTVRMDFWTSAMEPFARQVLHPQLEESLDALVRILSRESGTPSSDRAAPPARVLDASANSSLVETARQCAREQAQLADRLLDKGDAIGWFARIYEYVTQGLTGAALNGTFEHSGWVLRLIPVFHEYYMRNINAWYGERTNTESHWHRALRSTERAQRKFKTRFEQAMASIYYGMRAHIEDDLPRTLARIYVEHYAEDANYVRFRADYLRMAQVFTDASEQLLTHLPKSEWTQTARVMRALTPAVLRQRAMDKNFYPIDRRRREAFDRGGRIAELMLAARGVR